MNCTASPLKARNRFLHPPEMCYLKFEFESMNSSCFLGDQSEALPIDEKKRGGTKQRMFC